MRIAKLLLFLMAVIGLVMVQGCGKAEKADETDATETAAESSVGNTAESSVGSAAEMADATKDEFVAKVKADMDEWNDKIAELEKRIEAVPEMTRQPFAAPLKDLIEKRDAAAAELATFEAAPEGDVEAGKTKVREACSLMETSYNSVSDLF